MLLIVLLFLFPMALFGDEENFFPDAPLLASIESEPSGIVDGCVNVISGSYFDYDVDLVVPGPEPLTVERVLISNNPDPMKVQEPPKWTFNDFQCLMISYKKSDNQIRCQYRGALGETLYFQYPRSHNPKGEQIGIIPKMLVKGQTNTAKGALGARTNIRNNSLSLHFDKGLSQVFTSTGSTLSFERKRHFKLEEIGKGEIERTGHLLKEEIKPNFLKNTYAYDELELSELALKSWWDVPLSSIQRSKKDRDVIYRAPDGREVVYKCEPFEIEGVDYEKINGVQRTDKPHIQYEYTEGRRLTSKGKRYYEWPHVKSKMLPNHRFLHIIYGDGVKKSTHCHVQSLKAPLGHDANPVTKYRFHYHITEKEGGCTGVYDALGHKTDYQYSKRGRLTGIIKYFDDGNPYTMENLYWGERDTHKEIELQSRTFGLFNSFYKTFAKVYTYDFYGNVIQEALYGNIKGKKEGNTLLVDMNGIPISGTSDCFAKSYEYSPDHLLLKTMVGTHSVRNQYIPSTNLISASFSEENGKIYKRHFYFYNEVGMVIQQVIDDGVTEDIFDLTHVTERKIETVERSTTYPVGLPIVVSEYYLDLETNKQICSLKKVNSYDLLGRLIKEETYGSDDYLAYVKSWEYDSHGNITKEVLPDKNVILRSYDLNDNLIAEIGPNPSVIKYFTYDYMNRLIAIVEHHSDAVVSKQFHYDLAGNLIAKIDGLGNETKTFYDNFHRPRMIEAEKIQDINGHLYHPRSYYEYDEMSNPTKIISPDGGVTEFAYTIFKKPYCIRYPDGTEERFEYDLEGRLVREVGKTGLELRYTYDVEGRVIKKQQLTSSKEEAYTQTYTYNAFHLLSETDPAGHLTTYAYDYQGRKISETKGDYVTYYEYDSLNGCCKTTITSLSHPQEGSAKAFVFDVWKRPIEERVENLQGEVLTLTHNTYDEEGRKTKIEQNGGITSIAYDSHGTAFESIDPEGNVTKTRQVLNYYNVYGQRVLRTETTDPLGQTIVIISDTHGRVAERIILNPLGEEIKKTSLIYNGSGKCIRSIESGIIRSWEYDTSHRLIGMTQALGTPDERRTTHTYNTLGQLETTIKSDGVILYHHYDSLARLLEQISSDDTIHYRYIYDVSSNPIQVDHPLSQTSTRRTYDSHGRVIEEVLANGLKVSFSYTPEGNLRHIVLPDSSTIDYTYNGVLLSSVTRKDYTHTYIAYDGVGNPLEASLIHNLGTLSYEYDLNGRPTSLTSPFYKEKMTYNPLGDLIERTFHDKMGEERDQYTYDSLYQLSRESGPFNHTYTNDSLYNRTSKDDELHSYNSRNCLLSDGHSSYAYTLSGNLLSYVKEGKTYHHTYDALDRLTKLQIDNTVYDYLYDEQNRCIARTVTEGRFQLPITEQILFVGQNDIGTARNHKLHTLRILGKTKGGEIGAAIAIEIQGKTYAPLHDHRGNLVALVDKRGRIKETIRYSAFGEECSSTSLSPWRFSSKRQEGNYLLFGRRFYIPSLGRFLTPDPLGPEGGPNLYTYTSNRPLTHIDPFGLTAQSSFLGAICNLLYTVFQYTKEIGYVGFQFAKQGISFAGSCIRHAVDHTIPVPVVKDAGCMLGFFLETGGPLDHYPASFSNNNSDFLCTDRPNPTDGSQYIFINGVCNSQEAAVEGAYTMSDTYGGMNVHLGYNGTLGFVGDIIECVLQKLGVVTPSIQPTIDAIRYSIQQVGGVGSGGFVKVDAHSQGGTILNFALQYLTPEERKMLCVTTYGSATLIDPTGLKSCTHYISNGDFVPLIGDPIGYTAARLGLRSDVVFLKQIDGLFEHEYKCKTYQMASERSAREFKREFLY